MPGEDSDDENSKPEPSAAATEPRQPPSHDWMGDEDVRHSGVPEAYKSEKP